MRVLVMRFSALGDVALTVPVIEELKKQQPELEIYYLSRPWLKPLFKPLDIEFIGADIDKQYTGFFGLFKLAQKIIREVKPNLVIDLHYVLRTRILSLFFRLKSIKVSTIDKGRQEKKILTRAKNKVIKPLKHTTERYAEAFQKAGVQLEFAPSAFEGLKYQGNDISETIDQIKSNPKSIGIAPFAKHKAKMWPLQKTEELIKELVEKGISVYLFGGLSEKKALQTLAEIDGAHSLAARFDLSSELNLLSHLKLMVSMDSSNMHLAALAGIPVISIWGATHPYAGFAPLGNNEEHIIQVPTDELSCRPCSVFGNKPCIRTEEPYACLKRIKVSEIVDRIEKMLK